MPISSILYYNPSFMGIKPKTNKKAIKPSATENTTSKLSEKEKMLSGIMYSPVDKELLSDKMRAKKLCFRYNSMPPENYTEMKQVLRSLLGKIGQKVWIEQNFKCDYGYNIEIGNNFFSNYNLVILDTAKVKFGDNVFIGPNCGFYTPNHPRDAKLRATGIQNSKPITVGNNVWIGGNVTVLGGVKIGDNVIVGAGSVVTKDLPSNTICCGVPCKVIKQNK